MSGEFLLLDLIIKNVLLNKNLYCHRVLSGKHVLLTKTYKTSILLVHVAKGIELQ